MKNAQQDALNAIIASIASCQPARIGISDGRGSIEQIEIKQNPFTGVINYTVGETSLDFKINVDVSPVLFRVSGYSKQAADFAASIHSAIRDAA